MKPLLTRRQRQIIEAYADGFTGKQISEILEIGPRTVDTHRYLAIRALNAKNLSNAISIAHQKKIIE